MALNLSALSQIAAQASTLGNLVLVSPEVDAGIQANSAAAGIQRPPKFLFHYWGEQSVSLESEITDHYTEENSALQDHIALKPETITGVGYIGELNNVTPEALQPLRTAAEKLTIISAYTPGLSVAAFQAYETAFQAYQVAKLAGQVATSAWSALSSSSAPADGGDGVASFGKVQNLQQQAFQMFYAYRKQRRLFSVQTPWAVFRNCAIMRLKAVQDPETTLITSFEITFKPIQYAKTTSSGTSGLTQGRLTQQSAEGSPANLGDSLGSPTDYTARDLFTRGLR
jgi:hypothetical protein